MSYPSNTETLALRYAPYIQELHEFFKSSGLHFGSPEDIQVLAHSLTTQGTLSDEMASMVRSIVYREHKAIPRTELLELIVVAIGGPQIDQSAQQVHEPVREILAFISEVMRSLRRNAFLDDLAVDAEPSSQSSAHGLQDDLAPVTAVPSPARRSGELTAEDVEEDVEDWPADSRPSHPNPLIDASSSHRPVLLPFRERSGNLDSFTASSDSAHIPPGSALAVAHAASPKPSARRNFWLPGVCLLLLGLGIGLLWSHRSSSRIATKQDQPVAMASNAGAIGVPRSNLNPKAPSPAPTSASTSPVGLSQAQHSPSVPRSTGESTGATLPNSPASAALVPAAPKSAPPSNPASSQPATPRRTARAASQPSPSAAARPAPPASPSTSATQNSFLVSSGVMSGNLISSPAPRYPRMASMTGVEGQVILQAVVSRNGTVVATHVLDGHHLLRGAAAKAVKRWRYKPYMVNGRPADVATIVIVDFHLPH